ncbi:hypothetical protein Pla108_38260 [Botrimarina colliarenosi]|uniref:Uncharacterized protein n=1 Tax=Botrimarina colliarenosi TaxID=2528001 RepID=A0A5C6A2J3_9BACT|nr:hypothetical protein Pla108_38260 [Botrimarina colliarenosi]
MKAEPDLGFRSGPKPLAVLPATIEFSMVNTGFPVEPSPEPIPPPVANSPEAALSLIVLLESDTLPNDV